MWQVLYDELKDEDFVMIAVALDTGGKAAVEPKIRPAEAALDELKKQELLASLMGWGEEVWQQMAPPQYPCLIDEEHHVADLLGIMNVPQAVWIDEEGRIVRPAETAGFGDTHHGMDTETLQVTEEVKTRLRENRRHYFNAIRDWVAKGQESEYALAPDEVRRRMRRPSEADARAAAHARLSHHLFGLGEHEAAKRHLEEAVRLCPENWNYFRQSMVLEPELVGQLNTAPEFFAAQAALGDKPYQTPIDMPGIIPDPAAR